MQIWERTGSFVKLQAFRLEQGGQHLCFTQPVTAARTLAPVTFVRALLSNNMRPPTVVVPMPVHTRSRNLFMQVVSRQVLAYLCS